MKVGNIEIEVIKKDIKNLHLGVYPPDGRVRIASPNFMNDDDIRLYAISKFHWIKAQQEKFKNQERQSAREFHAGESIYYFGERYILKTIESNQNRINLTSNNTIEFYTKPDTTEKKKNELFTEWYRTNLKEKAEPLILKWIEKTGITINDWNIKKMKTKWGTCNIEEKRIWLNLELAKKPIRCIEYIILHELIHLKHRHHNHYFTTELEQFMPNWKFYKDELNNFIL